MKTKHKDRLDRRRANYNEKVNEEGRNKRNERVKQDQSSSREEETSADYEQVKQTLSRGYNPDGPGGNYRGV